MIEEKKVLVTGGAGFIGTHLVERLCEQNEVHVLDNLSAGDRERVPEEAVFHEADLMRPEQIDEALDSDFDTVFHLAANPDVKLGAEDTRMHTEQNVVATLNLLESMRENGVDEIVFTSTSTVYGEDVPFPTPETYGPLEPISLYGASKLACEGLCTSFEGTFGVEATVYRLANIVGGDGHGVVPDFVRKLRDDPERLEILGDGRQRKSYLHVSDCVDAMLLGVEGDETIYNIGSDDTVSVTRIAEVVSEEMDLEPEFEYTGGRRGWKGDVPRMRLSVERIESLGWEPSWNSEESVRKATREMLETPSTGQSDG